MRCNRTKKSKIGDSEGDEGDQDVAESGAEFGGEEAGAGSGQGGQKDQGFAMSIRMNLYDAEYGVKNRQHNQGDIEGIKHISGNPQVSIFVIIRNGYDDQKDNRQGGDYQAYQVWGNYFDFTFDQGKHRGLPPGRIRSGG